MTDTDRLYLVDTIASCFGEYPVMFLCYGDGRPMMFEFDNLDDCGLSSECRIIHRGNDFVLTNMLMTNFSKYSDIKFIV